MTGLTEEELAELRDKLDVADYDWQDVEGLAYALGWLLEERDACRDLVEAAEAYRDGVARTREHLEDGLKQAAITLACRDLPDSEGARRRALGLRREELATLNAGIVLLECAAAR